MTEYDTVTCHKCGVVGRNSYCKPYKTQHDEGSTAGGMQ